MTREGYLILNEYGRFEVDGVGIHCGDRIKIFDEGEWIEGTVEANSDGQYYATDGIWVIYLKEGLKIISM